MNKFPSPLLDVIVIVKNEKAEINAVEKSNVS